MELIGRLEALGYARLEAEQLYLQYERAGQLASLLGFILAKERNRR